MVNHAGVAQKVEVKSKEADQYHAEYAAGNKDHLTYEELINMLNRDTEEGHNLWTFQEILDHRTIKEDGRKTMQYSSKGIVGHW